jgi:membrane-associated phospholipid phosphatase
VTAAYFAYLTVVAIARRKPRPAALSMATLVAVFVVGMPHVMPLVYLLAGYWLPAMVVRQPNAAVQRGLLRFDRTLFGQDGLARFERRAPRLLIEYLEAAYLLCYAVPLAGYMSLLAGGHAAATIDRFWTIVLLASFACYGLLPWMPTRAPRAIEPPPRAPRSWIRRANLAVLDRASVQWNTFPSGHTAASLAAALAVGTDMPIAGMALAALAVSIAIGSVVGRYHYAADALTGAAVAILAFLMGSATRAL